MRSLLTCLVLLTTTLLPAQSTSSDSLSAERGGFFAAFRSSERYAVNPWVSIPLVAGGAYLSQQRLLELQDKPRIAIEVIQGLDKDDINGFDRVAVTRDYDRHKQALIQSDYFFNTGQWAPFGLFIWKKYRQDWFDITLMYLEAQTSQGLFYGFAPFGPTGIDRFRPVVYYDEIDPERETDGNNRNSTFSGHVSTMSTGFYYMARMIDDYNPDLTGGQRVLLYTGATLPSLYGGWLRVKALKHYPSDVLIGLGVGAISGIGVPSLHKWWKQRHSSDLVLQPVYGGGAGGFSLVLRY
ncbi:phosphatase PAP2 family protein [Lewinella sp. JB7]|uniref:phosphatase PAP2 family protein n=1 Tax=Lewinella sp. JB7 TaxID=2962887 RepID=UPI0020C9B885|nr:phosphatase PAP2 family protein [Lewinella sp. JB7]MCP9235783.1 phosphatase PAP2 family protein [Lewinella sp. JB7]